MEGLQYKLIKDKTFKVDLTYRQLFSVHLISPADHMRNPPVTKSLALAGKSAISWQKYGETASRFSCGVASQRPGQMKRPQTGPKSKCPWSARREWIQSWHESAEKTWKNSTDGPKNHRWSSTRECLYMIFPATKNLAHACLIRIVDTIVIVTPC